MDLLTHIHEAFSNLFSSKLRSFLAVLGILVGTGSVVALIMSSQAATDHALEQFKSLGTNIIAANLQSNQAVASQGQQQQFRLNQLPELWTASKQIALIAPYINLYQSIYVKGISTSAQVIGATDSFAEIIKLHVHTGRFISVLDKNQEYCVIGSTLAKKIRDHGANPMGQQILVGKSMFTVIGVLDSWKPNLFLYADLNNGLIIPLQASYFLSKDAQINDFLFRLIKNPNLDLVQKKLQDIFLKILPTLKVMFRNPQNIIDIVAKSRRTFSLLLACIGSISLLVGGIGVMNIMLVSVVERRREIGVRMALGARRADIKKMFLIEAIFLTVFGGLLGILIGVSVSITISIVSGWGFEFFWTPPLLGFGVSVLVGIFSGYYPAVSASKLDPIQTLQSE